MHIGPPFKGTKKEKESHNKIVLKFIAHAQIRLDVIL